MSQRIASKHKETVYCTIKGCKYTSRQWVVKNSLRASEINQRNSVFSTKCPKHQTELVTIDKLKN